MEQDKPKKKRRPWTPEQRERASKAAKERIAKYKDDPTKPKWGRPKWTPEQKETFSKIKKEQNARRAEEEWEKAAPIIEENKRIRRENTQLAPLEEGERKTHARFLREARVGYNLPTIDISDPVQVEQRINDYLDFCEVNDKRPNIVGVRNWLGLTSTSITRMKDGAPDANRNTSKLIQKMYNMFEEFMVDELMESKFPTNFIFLLKNMFGYKDQTDVVVGQGSNNDVDVSKEDLEKWFLEDGKTVETTFTDEQKAE